MEKLEIKFDGALYDKLVQEGAPEMGDLKIVVKEGGMASGAPAVVIAFTAVLSDGTRQPVQAVTTGRLLKTALQAIVAKYGALFLVALAFIMNATVTQAQVDSSDYLINEIEKKHSGVITIPAGTYYISKPLLKFNPGRKLTIQGEGPRATNIVLLDNVADPIFEINGTDTNPNSWFTLRDITLNGNGCSGTWVKFNKAFLNKLERVEFFNTAGTALLGIGWWDSHVEDCHFARCGTSELPAVHLRAPSSTDWYWASNNIKFQGCRFENNDGLPLLIDELSRKMSIVQCKFHGKIPASVPSPHIKMYKAIGCQVIACNVTNGASDGIHCDQVKGVVITGNSIDALQGRGIFLKQCVQPKAENNTFGVPGTTGPCAGGDVVSQ